MAYQSLYRRYRPRRFADVLGQEQLVGGLRNAVRDDRVGHAYLFSGPRGTGKTSTARILAKALNCTNLQDGEPCCECEACLSIEAGTSYDLQELDAASNNKVENVRDLIERVALGSPGRTKVYILDEVHMLSPGASNALLKTLEEPPPHVVFVLATTDPHKVLPTIRSRTQHFEFHLLPADVLADHVRWVIEDAGLDVSPEAIEQVVRQGGGSARDTLSALDQVAAAGGVTESTEHAEALADAVCARDTGMALRTVADAVGAGRDPRILGETLLARLRDAFLVRMGATLPQATDRERAQAETWAAQLTDRSTTLALEEVGAALLEMRQAPDPRIPLEVALVRITRVPEGEVAALTERVDRLERALAAGGTGALPASAAGPSKADDTATPPAAPSPSDAAAGPASGNESPTPEPAPAPSSSSRPGGARPGDAARAILASKGAAAPTGKARSADPAPPAPPPPPPRTLARAVASDREAPGPTDGPAGPSSPAVAADPTAPTPGPAATSGPAAAAAAVTEAGGPAPAEPAGQARPDLATSAPTPEAVATEPQPATATNASPPAAGTNGGGLSAESFLQGWTDAVLPKLAGITGAMFRPAVFVGLDGDVATFAVSNDVTRQRSEQNRPDVEKVVAAHFDRPITLKLVIDGNARPDMPAARPTARDVAEIDLAEIHDLEDAPADPRSGVDRLAEAFPGAVIEETPQP